MTYLPLFIDLTNNHLLIVGGGNIAYHKAKILLEFEGTITLIAPAIIEPIKALP
ncbi:MAG: NAD(P)-dependent oxidoreductase, partial [Erysipelotrichaceae bacterium]|nr:NAD(P)-dependent oxidoreductase [Erysipelotrichaceae bacterium]